MTRATERPSFSDALDMIRQSVRPLGTKVVEISQAIDDVLAEPIIAAHHVPRFNCSAMDGFVLRSAETQTASSARPMRLELVSPSLPGAPPPLVPPVSAAQITTGAPIPEDLDAVLVRERGEVESGRLVVREPVAPSLNIRRVGEDFRAGDIILEAGARLDPIGLAAAAAVGVSTVSVRPRPRLGLFSTGDEVRRSGEDPGVAQIFDCNSPMIEAMASQLGLDCAHFGHGADDVAAVVELLDRAVDSGRDIGVSTGGVSGGRYDVVADAVAAHGGELIFHGVRMRPGKPLLFAMLRNGRPFFGLPGNPVAALVGFRFFVSAALRRLAALPDEVGELVRTDAQGKADTTVVLRCHVDRDDPVRAIVTGFDQRSHILSSLLKANAWLRIDPSFEGQALLYNRWASMISPRRSRDARQSS